MVRSPFCVWNYKRYAQTGFVDLGHVLWTRNPSGCLCSFQREDCRQGHSLKALNEHSTKFQALQTACLQTGEAHPLKALIKVPKKTSFRLGKFTHSRLWLNFWPNVGLCRLLGNFTCSRLWFFKANQKLNSEVCLERSLLQVFDQSHDQKPKTKLSRLLGKVTPSRLRLLRQHHFGLADCVAAFFVQGLKDSKK